MFIEVVKSKIHKVTVTEANLQYIDFIKVQCGVLAKSGWLGEVSTEVFSFEDLTK